MNKIYLNLTIIFFTATALHAQHNLPIYEPFSGNLGSLAGQLGWTGNATPGAGAQVVNFPMTYIGLPAASTSNSVLFGNQTSGGTQALGFTSQTSTVYASFLIQVSSIPLTLANSRYNFGFGTTSTGGTFAGCMYVVPTSTTTFELGFNGTNSQPTTQNTTNESFQLNTTIMVVMAYTPGASGTGTVSAWVNPNASSFGSTEPTPTFSNIAGGSAANVACVFIRSGNNTNPMNIDELRVGTSWVSVTSYSVPLPVSIVGLKLATKDNISKITWSSMSEINFDRYVVMYSNNAIDFTEIGALIARGNNTQYSFDFKHIVDGYFKLKMIDLDGRYVYSNMLYAKRNAVNVTVIPNPFSDKLFISNLPLGQNTINLFSIGGLKLNTQTANSSNISLSLVSLPIGKYILNITNAQGVVYSKVFLKN
jgi:hypothetical protein